MEEKQYYIYLFTNKYNVDRLVHYEMYDDVCDAIERGLRYQGLTLDSKGAM